MAGLYILTGRAGVRFDANRGEPSAYVRFIGAAGECVFAEVVDAVAVWIEARVEGDFGSTPGKLDLEAVGDAIAVRVLVERDVGDGQDVSCGVVAVGSRCPTGLGRPDEPPCRVVDVGLSRDVGCGSDEQGYCRYGREE
jgi:hypothetical protein